MVLSPLVQKFPRLKVVMEHVTTMDAVKFVESCTEGDLFYLIHLFELLSSCQLKELY